ncbi:IS1 family transposase [Candidatus Sumerlaeota bacterium]|nr:IS1 family transposase [Candidatus Sumerlaeota bacterium]
METNQLTAAKRIAVLNCLTEGCSIRSMVRMTGVAKNTVSKLLLALGEVCANYQDQTLVNLKCKGVQCDEIWSFVGKKAKNTQEGEEGVGDCWTFTAICADSKLIPCWFVGDRGQASANAFISDLARRMSNRIRLSTDGHSPYFRAVVEGFNSGDVDYGRMVKIYKTDLINNRRYSTTEVQRVERTAVIGYPEEKSISTSYVERQNLSMRMNMRRFTRLTNAFSKKMLNHEAAIAIYFMHYNFVKVHSTLRVSPAMAAGVTDKLWDNADIVKLLDATEKPCENALIFFPKSN